jgi:hypothetical protein
MGRRLRRKKVRRPARIVIFNLLSGIKANETKLLVKTVGIPCANKKQI